MGCLTEYDKQKVKDLYRSEWQKCHSDSLVKTSHSDGLAFMQVYGYCFKNIPEKIDPLMNPESFLTKTLNWQAVWDLIVAVELKIVSQSMESTILEKYIEIVSRVATG